MRLTEVYLYTHMHTDRSFATQRTESGADSWLPDPSCSLKPWIWVSRLCLLVTYVDRWQSCLPKLPFPQTTLSELSRPTSKPRAVFGMTAQAFRVGQLLLTRPAGSQERRNV